MSAHAEDIQAHVKTYVVVFAVLAALTVITVAISYLDLSTPMAIAVALLVASTKAGLVALFFMHLIDEKKIIYALLALAVVFFAMCMSIPTGWHVGQVKSGSLWSSMETGNAAIDHGDSDHGDSGHGDSDHGNHDHGDHDHDHHGGGH